VKVVLLGLSITSSWGNGHATNYRALVRELAARDHDVLFLERDRPWYAAHRDLAEPPWGRTCLYGSLDALRLRFCGDVRAADLVIVGSYVPEGAAVGEWVTSTASGLAAFYDIDTPVTLADLARGRCEYLSPGLIGRYDLYLSFTGGPTLDRLEHDYGARRAIAFHCLVDPDAYFPQYVEPRWDLGYLGTYSADRQPQVDELLLEPARAAPRCRFAAAGPQYPSDVVWPPNVERLEHVPPADHARFYAAQRWTLNVTRADMRAAGWSPSVRLFEAAACGVPVISDRWDGLDELFADGTEIVMADSAMDVLRALHEIPDDERRAIGSRARRRVLAAHTAGRRVDQLEELAGVTV